MKRVEVNYTKRYYKTTTKFVMIPDGEDEDEYLEKNKLELFEDEITSASLNLEEDEIEIWREDTREDMEEWFYSHNNEWQNDIEIEFEHDTEASTSDVVVWAFEKYNQ